jgi:hypothetical protein
MAYTQQTWNNGAIGATPISAARLSHMEAGIFGAIPKGDHVVSVKDFGAVGNGSTDDTSAIAAAYAAAAGKPLLFPKGDYLVTALPALVDGDRLIGVGPKDSEITYAGTGTLLPLTGRQDISIRSLSFHLSGVGAKAIDLSACFQISMDDVRVRGAHDGTTSTTYHGQKGLILRDNTGNTRIHNSTFERLGCGIETSCIQNEMTNSKVVECYVGVRGVGGTANAGLIAIGCEFIGHIDPDTVVAHVDITGSANTWVFDACWFEGSDYCMKIGVFGSGGPSSLTLVGCKFGARIVGLQFNNCRQPSVIACEFNLDSGGTMDEIVFGGSPAGDEVIEGLALNLVTTIRSDFDDADFPQYWVVTRRGSLRAPNVTVSSNITIDGTTDTGNLKIRNGAAVGKVWKCTNADGSGSWQTP